MNGIIKSDKKISLINYEEAIKKINMYYKSSYYSRTNYDLYHNHVELTQDFSTRNIRKSYFQSCQIIGSKFYRSGVSGSSFIDCNIINSELKNANFHSCNFTNSCITFDQMSDVISVGFHKSSFSNTSFSNINFISVGFTDAFFDECEFNNCTFKGVTFENSTLMNSTIKNTSFDKLNMDYLELENVKMDNVVLPFISLPNIIGGLKYVLHTTDNVVISSNVKPSNTINRKEYIQLLPSIEIFLKYNQDYFGLANLNLATDKIEEAYKYILRGIQNTIHTRNFRQLLYFCKLSVSSNQFQIYRNDLFNKILEWGLAQNFSVIEGRKFKFYLGQIEYYLLQNKMDLSQLKFSFRTNIDYRDTKSLGVIIDILNDILIDTDDNKISISHKSPYLIDLTILDSVSNLTEIVGILYAIFKFSDKFLDLVLKYQSISERQIEINEKKQAIASKKRAEIEKYKKILDDNEIIVKEAEHNIVSLVGNAIDKTLAYNKITKQ